MTFEGGEGAGKSTQLTALAERARAAGARVVTCREPGGTELGERLRSALLGLPDPPDPRAELLTFAAARAQLVAEVVAPALAEGALVLCDRFADSTVAYQHYGRGLDLALVRAVNEAATAGVVPDLTVLLDVPPSVGLTRDARTHDYMEREALALHERVRAGYLELAAAAAGRWLVVDATRPPAEVSAAVWGRVRELVVSVRDARGAARKPL